MENTLLNLIPAAYLPEIHLSQYDVGRTITFTLKDGASDYSVPSGASVKVKATKPSGFGFEVACTFNGGTVTLVTTDTMTPENGRFPAELSIVSGNTVIGTSNFIFNVERSPHPEGTIDGDAETIIPELTLLVERIEAAAEDVDEKAELFLNLSVEAETLPAGSPATASYSDGVLTLGIPRGYDGDDTKADAIVKSASGEVASFTDGGNGLLVKSLNVNITPKQSGSGDPSPSNVRPISGYSDVNVTRCGKNLFDKSTMVKMWYMDSNGKLLYDGTTILFSVPIGTEFILSGTNGNRNRLCYIDKPLSEVAINDVTTFISNTNLPIHLTSQHQTYVYYMNSTQNASLGDSLQLELGSTATAYEPYEGESKSISLGQTVYGGTLEVMSGKLTLTHAYVDMGSLSWNYQADSLRFSTSSLASVIKRPPNGDGVASIVCSIYRAGTYAQVSVNPPRDFTFAIHSNYGFIYTTDSRYTDKTSYQSAMNGVQLVYELATPTEITLTPTQVKTLLGNNNIFADSGSVEVEYRADTTLAYNELVAMILENIGN